MYGGILCPVNGWIIMYKAIGEKAACEIYSFYILHQIFAIIVTISSFRWGEMLWAILSFHLHPLDLPEEMIQCEMYAWRTIKQFVILLKNNNW